MYFRRFRGSTMREALSKAREGLGPGAVVLSSDLVPVHGWRGLMGAREVEITAAAEREVSEQRPGRPAGRPSRRGEQGIVAALCAAGFDAECAADIARQAGRTRSARAAVAAWATSLCARDEDYASVEVFVGPPGAGKTTSIAKIAAQQRAASGRRLSLISADGFRVGAIEQLRLYADIIGTPFDAARNAAELQRLLEERRGSVLVDTAGRSPRDDSARAVDEVLARTPGVRTHLVIPAASTARGLDRLLDARAWCPDRVVLTKADEAESAAPLSTALRARGLRVSYVTMGQRVPEDLVRATPASLAAALLGEAAEAAGSAA